jgi:hypothetical protein
MTAQLTHIAARERIADMRRAADRRRVPRTPRASHARSGPEDRIPALVASLRRREAQPAGRPGGC